MSFTVNPIAALTLITHAFSDLGVISPEDTLEAAQAQDGLYRLNQMLNGWAALPKTQRFLKREVFATVSGQRDYTIGPGGNFNTTTPEKLVGAGLLLNGSTPPVEIPRGLLTEDGWEAIQIKDLQNSLWTQVYFQPTYSGGLATVTLWPVPNTSLNSCVLYSRDVLQSFANLTTTYYLPNAYPDALEYQLALRLCVAGYGVPEPVIARVQQLANASMMILKRANYTITDLPLDPALMPRTFGGYYNIDTGSGGGTGY